MVGVATGSTVGGTGMAKPVFISVLPGSALLQSQDAGEGDQDGKLQKFGAHRFAILFIESVCLESLKTSQFVDFPFPPDNSKAPFPEQPTSTQ